MRRMMDLYDGRYLITLYEPDDDTLIGVFDNTYDFAEFIGKDIGTLSGILSRQGRIEGGCVRYKGRLCRLHLVSMFEEDIMHTFKEFRENWLLYLGDMDCVVEVNGHLYGQAHSAPNGRRIPCKKLNDSYFDKYEDYVIEDVQLRRRLRICLKRV